ncbi:MAG: Diaminopimelate decarboxylase [Candidatus Kapaibacterium sp.]|nr:MAG: Diaminopimelate decarboxylase [Candidatus Kapabacteria bacterium]
MDFIGNVDVKSLATEFGTPLYVYDRQKIRNNYFKLFHAFSKYFNNFKIHFSVKSNSNVHILKEFKELGCGVDCSSPFELLLVLKAGFDPTDIIYTGNYESDEDFALISRYNIKINFDDITSYERFKKYRQPEFVSFRVNPGIGKGGFEGITTGGADAKFGVPYELLPQAYRKAKDDGARYFGVHIMTGSNILEPIYFAEVVEKLFRIVGRMFQELKIKPEYIDIGGGFGIPYTDDENELDIDKTAEVIFEVYQEYCNKFGFGEPQLKIEPGRYLIGNAGYLISKVTGIKKGYKKFVGIDAGMNTLIRPALYGAIHRIKVYGKREATNLVQICGQICENSDILLKNVPFPDIQVGDICIIEDVGAYGFSMASNYNSRPLPVELLVDNGKVKLIRRRQTFEDYIHLMEVD